LLSNIDHATLSFAGKAYFKSRAIWMSHPTVCGTVPDQLADENIPKPGSVFSESVFTRRLLNLKFDVFYLIFTGPYMKFSNNKQYF